MYAAPLPAALGLADRLTLILGGLRAALAARMAADRTLAPLLTLLWSRLSRAGERFARIVTAGPRPIVPRQGDTARSSGRPDRLPRGVAWLIRLVPEAAVYGAQLQALLADPAMQALFAAAPRAGRVVRPLCRMLAVPPGPAARIPSVACPAAAPKPPVALAAPDPGQHDAGLYDAGRSIVTLHEPDPLEDFAPA